MARTSPQVRDSRVIQVFFKQQRCHSCSCTSPQLPTRPPGLAILFMVTPRWGGVLPGASRAVFLRDAQCALSYAVRRPERWPAVRSLVRTVRGGRRAAAAGIAPGHAPARPTPRTVLALRSLSPPPLILPPRPHPDPGMDFTPVSHHHQLATPM